MVYLTLSSLLTLRLEPWGARATLLALAIALTLAVGVSRVVLGVHWPSDVLAGWSAGSAWALAAWLIATVTGWFDRTSRNTPFQW